MPRSITEIRNRQTVRIYKIIEALMSEGFCSLNEQAVALGLNRSTVWNMRRGNHKSYGLSPKIIDRMLSSPQLPSSVRIKIAEYVEDKAAGNFMPVRSRGRIRGTIAARGIQSSNRDGQWSHLRRGAKLPCP